MDMKEKKHQPLNYVKNIHTYRHAFNPRRGRQRCTLWHVMPLCTSTFHNLCCKSHVIDSVLLLRNFRKTENTPSIHCPTWESNPRPLVRQSHLRPLDQRGSRYVINVSEHYSKEVLEKRKTGNFCKYDRLIVKEIKDS
uniref:SFRICE_020079 n=1 Tax=Spodoptera frugiperda TaxID=7108 RepID=A0A2H1V552_SPOFR